MPLDYRDGQWELDGAPLTDAELAAYRDAMADDLADELGQVAIAELGQLERDDRVSEAVAAAFVLLLMRRVTDGVLGGYTAARGGVAAGVRGGVTPPTPAQWTLVVDIVVRQQLYANGFGSALTAGQVSYAQAVARARMYAGSAVEAFSIGMAHRLGFNAPAHPTQGCRGGSNCRCYWSIVEFSDRFEATWKAVGDRDTCEVCRQRAKDWAPFVQQKPTGA